GEGRLQGKGRREEIREGVPAGQDEDLQQGGECQVAQGEGPREFHELVSERITRLHGDCGRAFLAIHGRAPAVGGLVVLFASLTSGAAEERQSQSGGMQSQPSESQPATTDAYERRIAVKVRRFIIEPPNLQGNPEVHYQVDVMPGG